MRRQPGTTSDRWRRLRALGAALLLAAFAAVPSSGTALESPVTSRLLTGMQNRPHEARQRVAAPSQRAQPSHVVNSNGSVPARLLLVRSQSSRLREASRLISPSAQEMLPTGTGPLGRVSHILPAMILRAQPPTQASTVK